MKLEGKYCKDIEIFTDNIEEDAIKQIYEIAGCPEFKDSKIRIMPDTHSGKGIVIGFTAPMGDYVNPSHIGCDISCSVSSVFFDKRLREEDYPIFESRVKKAIPMGVSIHQDRQFDVKEFLKYLRTELQKAYQRTHGLTYILDFNNTNDLEAWVEKFGMDLATFYKSIGTLGGGETLIASRIVNSYSM